MVLVKQIDAVLPQTQCRECGYLGCLPYAEALAQGVAPINKCPPGGEATVKALAALLHLDPAPFLDDAREKMRPPQLALIRESECIGCTKCIQACPVDAIIGSAKLMHAIIEHECTGCGLCIEPCPVDCIEMVDLPQLEYDKELARVHFHSKKTRALRDEHEQQQSYRHKSQLAPISLDKKQNISAKKAYIEEALARVKAKKEHE